MMPDTMNRAARRVAKAVTAKRNPYLYPNIPAIEADHDFYPLKAFAVDVELMPALAPRLFLDRTRPTKGTINGLEGPASKDAYTVSLPFDKLREWLAHEETRRRETPIVLDDSVVPTGFNFGLLDIVTYPFFVHACLFRQTGFGSHR